MTKKYYSPVLQVVSINKKDIIATSDPALGGVFNGETILAPGQRGLFDPDDSWANAGY